MIGSLDKSYNRPILVDEDHLRYLAGIVEERFCAVEYVIKTIDGARFKLPTIDDLISYNNPDSRKIVCISIIGYKSKDVNGYFPEFSISLFDMSEYDASCILTLKKLEEAEITHITQRVDEFVKSTKTAYWWLHRPAFYVALGLIFYSVVIVYYYLSLGMEQWSMKENKTSILIGWSFICMLTSVYGIRKIVDYLFPEGGFVIGEQKKFMKKKDKTRNFIITIICTVIFGVISGLIVNFISN